MSLKTKMRGDAELPTILPGRTLAAVVDIAGARRRRSIDNWLIALMIVCFSIFVGIFATHVFSPATPGLVGSITDAWTLGR